MRKRAGNKPQIHDLKRSSQTAKNAENAKKQALQRLNALALTGGNSKVPFFAILAIFAVKELPYAGLSASKRRAVTAHHEQTHCIGNAREAGFESHSEDITLGLFTRMGCPNGFRPGSNHLSFDITPVTQRPPGRPGREPRASGLASGSMSESECYERSNSFVPLSPSGHLFSTDSVHLDLFGLIIGRICRAHRTVCHRCKCR